MHIDRPLSPTIYSEAEQIEAARRELLLRSDEIRRGILKPHEHTIRSLAGAAVYLFHSQAPSFEKLATLNEVQANLGARTNSRNAELRTIADLSTKILTEGLPQDTYAPERETERRVRLWAIMHTNTEQSFVQALEKGWEQVGLPLDLLIEQSDQIIEKSKRIAVASTIEQEPTGSYQLTGDALK